MIIRLFSTYIGHFVIILLNKTNYRMVSSFLFIFAGMEKIYNYYQDIVTAYTRRADNLKKKIHLLGSIRLLLVAGLIAMVWFFKSEDWKVLAGIAVLFTIPFIALMVWHTKLFARKCYAEALANLCKNELNGLDYDFSAFDGAPEKSSAEHSFSLDLDLFGNHSLFQSVNRTVTFMGKEKLAGWFMQPLTDKAMILRRQEAIRELESFTQLRQHFYVTGILHPGNKDDQQLISLLSKAAPCLINNKIWKLLICLIPSIWVLVAIGCALNLLPVSIAGMFFGLSFIIAYLNAKQIATVHNSLDRMEQILQTYSKLIKCIDVLFIRIFSQQQPDVLPPRGADAFGIALRIGEKLPGLQKRMADLVVNAGLGAQDLLFPRRRLHLLPILPKPPVHVFQAKIVLFQFPLEPRFLGDVCARDLVNSSSSHAHAHPRKAPRLAVRQRDDGLRLNRFPENVRVEQRFAREQMAQLIHFQVFQARLAVFICKA